SLVAGETPRKLIGRLSNEDWVWNRQREQRSEQRKHADLAFHAIGPQLPARKTKDVTGVDEIGRVVPAESQRLDRGRRELRELPDNQRSGEFRRNVKFCGPGLCHQAMSE